MGFQEKTIEKAQLQKQEAQKQREKEETEKKAEKAQYQASLEVLPPARRVGTLNLGTIPKATEISENGWRRGKKIQHNK